MFKLPLGRAGQWPLWLLLVLAACSPSPSIPSTTTAASTLIPYQTASATAAPQRSPTPEFTEPPLATPTPLTHSIAANETLIGLAERYGITLDALLAANPGVNASLLSIGQEILIPQGGEASANAEEVPSPTPAAAEVSETICYPTAATELYCFLLVSSPPDQALENLVGILRLFDAGGQELLAADLVAPLNLLPADAALPLMAYIPDPPEGWATARGRVLTAYASADPEERYRPSQIVDDEVLIGETGQSAQVAGSVEIEGGAPFSSLWVLAVAYDAEGRVVGQRRWESQGGQVDFDFYVYSLGPEIDSVELLAEARP